MAGRMDPVENFVCPKCHSREAFAREGCIHDTGLGDLLRLKTPGRFLLATCALCGFTELYDMSIVEKAAEPRAAEKRMDVGQEA